MSVPSPEIDELESSPEPERPIKRESVEPDLGCNAQVPNGAPRAGPSDAHSSGAASDPAPTTAPGSASAPENRSAAINTRSSPAAGAGFHQSSHHPVGAAPSPQPAEIPPLARLPKARSIAKPRPPPKRERAKSALAKERRSAAPISRRTPARTSLPRGASSPARVPFAPQPSTGGPLSPGNASHATQTVTTSKPPRLRFREPEASPCSPLPGINEVGVVSPREDALSPAGDAATPGRPGGTLDLMGGLDASNMALESHPSPPSRLSSQEVRELAQQEADFWANVRRHQQDHDADFWANVRRHQDLQNQLATAAIAPEASPPRSILSISSSSAASEGDMDCPNPQPVERQLQQVCVRSTGDEGLDLLAATATSTRTAEPVPGNQDVEMGDAPSSVPQVPVPSSVQHMAQDRHPTRLQPGQQSIPYLPPMQLPPDASPAGATNDLTSYDLGSFPILWNGANIQLAPIQSARVPGRGGLAIADLVTPSSSSWAGPQLPPILERQSATEYSGNGPSLAQDVGRQSSVVPVASGASVNPRARSASRSTPFRLSAGANPQSPTISELQPSPSMTGLTAATPVLVDAAAMVSSSPAQMTTAQAPVSEKPPLPHSSGTQNTGVAPRQKQLADAKEDTQKPKSRARPRPTSGNQNARKGCFSASDPGPTAVASNSAWSTATGVPANASYPSLAGTTSGMMTLADAATAVASREAGQVPLPSLPSTSSNQPAPEPEGGVPGPSRAKRPVQKKREPASPGEVQMREFCAGVYADLGWLGFAVRVLDIQLRRRFWKELTLLASVCSLRKLAANRWMTCSCAPCRRSTTFCSPTSRRGTRSSGRNHSSFVRIVRASAGPTALMVLRRSIGRVKEAIIQHVRRRRDQSPGAPC